MGRKCTFIKRKRRRGIAATQAAQGTMLRICLCATYTRLSALKHTFKHASTGTVSSQRRHTSLHKRLCCRCFQSSHQCAFRVNTPMPPQEQTHSLHGTRLA
eukprot:Blabericola_migrator_1__10836@NODE_6235_length_574_cov_35_883629_g4202_i0_p1_GENE_NODE_6235_length_574_cov_35_883629_g4202_i0NODE_6235_length_574_cov_35_883629_g4202_i0_p1_ORF_typecomplete_len101_score0_57Nup54/PF13874_6/0_06_NODE_6235_length_574_cov_35_883629_g4202_i0131433